MHATFTNNTLDFKTGRYCKEHLFNVFQKSSLGIFFPYILFKLHIFKITNCNRKKYGLRLLIIITVSCQQVTFPRLHFSFVNWRHYYLSCLLSNLNDIAYAQCTAERKVFSNGYFFLFFI